MASTYSSRGVPAGAAVCALCDTEVTVVQRAPARRKVTASGARYRASNWCRLLPCGHTFMVPAGGLIR